MYIFIGNMKIGVIIIYYSWTGSKHILNDGFDIFHALVIEPEFFNAPSF